MQQLVQRFRLDAADGDLAIDQPFALHIHRRLSAASAVRLPARVCSMKSLLPAR